MGLLLLLGTGELAPRNVLGFCVAASNAFGLIAGARTHSQQPHCRTGNHSERQGAPGVTPRRTVDNAAIDLVMNMPILLFMHSAS